MNTKNSQQQLQSTLSQDALHSIGLFRNGMHLDAVAYLESALIQHTNAADFALLSDFYFHLGNMPQALKAIKHACEHDLNNISLQLKLVNLFLEAESYAFCKTCLSAMDISTFESEMLFEYHALYAKTLCELKEYKDSFKQVVLALEIHDDNTALLLLAGDVCYKLSHFDEAKKFFEKLLLINPAHHSALNYLSILYNALGLQREGIWFFLKLLRIQKTDGVLFNLGCSLLTIGKYDLGLRFYEHRSVLESENLTKRIAQNIWKGEPLDGKTLLIFSEQGCGDNLQFCRFIRELKKRYACEILYITRNWNTKITHSLSADIRIIHEQDIKDGKIILPKCDYSIPLMSLLKILKVREETHHLEKPYLQSTPERVGFYKAKIDALNLNAKLKVGLVWAGSKHYGNDHNRSFSAQKLSPILALKNISFFKLQVGERAKDLTNLHHLLPEDPDFHESGALIENLDLVITVDTSIAHLAGAMFKPVWCLITKDPDWRWGTTGESTNWYPTMQLFRQQKFGDWDSVIDRVKAKLTEMCV